MTDADVPPPASPAPSLAWTDPAFGELAALVHAHAGLVFGEGRQAGVEAGVRRAMQRAGIRTLGDYVAAVAALARDGHLDDPLLDDLLGELTVGETYFLREPAQFAFLRETVLPTLRAARGEATALRAWSAACASGEEAYSIAMMLHEAGLPGAVLGTDLAPERLAAARRARYRRWSLRGVPDAVVARWFRHDGAEWRLDAALRRMAEFRVLNLAGRGYPSVPGGIWGMDVVFCRNVLIYFDRPTIRHVAARLLDTLAADGWLFLGANDPPLAEFVPCEPVSTGGGLAYRRPEAPRWPGVGPGARGGRASVPVAPGTAGSAGAAPNPSQAPTGGDGPAPTPRPWEPRPGAPVPIDLSATGGHAPGSPASAPVPSAPVSPASSPAPRPTGAPAAAPAAAPVGDARLPSPGHPAVAADPETSAVRALAAGDYDRAVATVEGIPLPSRSPRAWIVLIRALANLGRLDVAGRAGAAALEAHPGEAELHHLAALLLGAAGRHAESADAARRALYLDPSLVVAHLALAAACARLDRRAQAARALDEAERLLARLPADAPVPAADGATADRLRAAARAQRTQLATP